MSVIREYGRGRPDPAVPIMPKETATVVSVFPRSAFSKVFQFGQYDMPPCPACEAHDRVPCDLCDNSAMLVVSAARDPIDDPNVTDGSARRFGIIPARQVAESLVVEGCLDRGIFIAEGDLPTHEELVAARTAYRIWAERMVKEADSIWAQKRDASWINPLAHDAARYLGMARDWMADTSKRVACLACGEDAKAGVVLCAKCGFPVQWQKAYDMGMLTEKQEKYGIKAKLIVSPAAEEAEEDKTAEEILEAAPPPKGRGRRESPSQPFEL
jgi:hypothetical protein